MSGIYIKNMTLDEFSEYGEDVQSLIGQGDATEIPNHGRLIDIDELAKSGARVWTTFDLKRFRCAPTVIPADKEE